LEKNWKVHSEVYFPRQKEFGKRIRKYLFKGKKERLRVEKKYRAGREIFILLFFFRSLFSILGHYF
jgi:hypothetical protein